MGEGSSTEVQRDVDTLTGLRPGDVLAGARGECLEDHHPGIKVQIGCGHKPWSGWLNIDGERASAFANLVTDIRSLPLETNSVDVIAAIHVIEHFYFWEVHGILRDWKRTLKPGGLLVLELPSFDKIMHYVAESFMQRKPMWSQMVHWALWGDPKYKDEAMCHRWGWTIAHLTQVLKECGFEKIQHEEPRYHIKKRDMRMTAHKPATPEKE